MEFGIETTVVSGSNSRVGRKASRTAAGANCGGGKNKVQIALELAAERLTGSDVLSDAALEKIANEIGVTPKTLGNWRRAGRVVTNDVANAFALEKLSGIPAAYLTRK